MAVDDEMLLSPFTLHSERLPVIEPIVAYPDVRTFEYAPEETLTEDLPLVIDQDLCPNVAEIEKSPQLQD